MKQITIFGNCTKDAELRTTQGGQKVCGFTVAVNDRRTKEAMFFEVAYWGKAGEAVAQYITKGNSVAVSGELSTREYNGKTYFQVNATSVTLGGGRRSEASAPPAKSLGDLDDEIPF